jgi:xanthine dehydrogenase molybdopterin-binding subunit B
MVGAPAPGHPQVFFAIRYAVASAGGKSGAPLLSAPATPEAVLRALNSLA